jgi:hypothetical protein
MVSYHPLYTHDEFSPDAVPATVPFRNILRSQTPHIFLDPTESQGGCMQLPFYWPYNAVRIPDSEWTQLGQLIIGNISDLRHANGALDPIQITVYAWCTDIHLSVPTSDQPVLEAQSGSKDEYGEGIVSDTAVAVSEVAGALSNAPIIGPYARATELAAKGIGDVAKAFGYSKPCDLSAVSAYQQANFGRLSTASGEDMAQKMTFDPKAELTIDPTVTGLDSKDEMAMKYLFSKESYLTTFSWGSGDVDNVRLGEVKVTPQLYNRYSPTGGYYMTSMCHASLPFRMWRGNIKFRLQIVASKFHKGRLLVSWDPNYFKSEEENIQYSKIVDISEDRDITFEVGWGQPEAYLRLNHDLPETVPFQSRSAAYTGRQDRCNGIVSIRVLNPLAVATDAVGNNNVDINVFVSAGDNFEVADPYIGSLRYSPFEEQSYEGPYEEQSDLLDASPPEADSQDTMGQEVIDKSALIYHSDPVISLRQILKRYTYAYRFPLVYQYTNPLYPGTQIAGCLRSA